MMAIILAAGYATRMYPLTERQPKALLPVGGKPILEHILEKVWELREVRKAAIVSNARFYAHFQRWRATYAERDRVILINDGSTAEYNRLGAVGDLRFAAQSLGIDDHLLVIAGDNHFGFPLTSLAETFHARRASVVALQDLRDPARVAGRYGVAELNALNRIIGFEEKPHTPKSTLASTACYILHKDAVAGMKEYCASKILPDNLGDFIAWTAQRRPAYGHIFTESWHDIGTIADYRAVQEKFSAQKRQ